MTRNPLEQAPVKIRRGFVWRLSAIAVAGFIVLSCAGSRTCQPDQPSRKPSLPATTSTGPELNFVPAPDSLVQLRGTATIGSWKSRSSDVQGKVILDTDAAALNVFFDQIQSPAADAHASMPSFRTPAVGDISVQVLSLHGDSNGMDRDMQKALKSKGNPTIEYIFQQLQNTTLQSDAPGHQGHLKLHILGKLIMAGVARPITMDVFVTRDSRHHFVAHAQTELLMTDFDVTPPGALFGLIKASDHVVVVFDIDFILLN